MDIIVTPQLYFRVEGEGVDALHLGKSFRNSRAEGLLELAKRSSLRSTSPSLSYWFDYASSFMRSLCAFSDADPLHIPLEKEFLEEMAQSAPLMQGAEYISASLLHVLWGELESYFRELTVEKGTVPRKLILDHYADWGDVGKIYFHLAENKTAVSKPFAFLATYSVRIPGKARVQHRPLGVALAETMDKTDNKHLEQLIRPIKEVSKRSLFVKKALKSNAIYRPLYMNPGEAFDFIKDIATCEEAGIVCRIPEGWQKKHPPRAKVSVKVGAQKGSHVGAHQLLDFDVGISVGGKRLTKAQVKKILDAEGPLVELGGKWIEVDRERINQMLKVWDKAVEKAYGEGISFAQAMRLMSGMGMDVDLNGEDKSAFQKWVEFTPGSAFSKLITSIRDPKAQESKAVDKVLARHLKGDLRPYQKKGVDWLHTLTKLKFGACLADDMGLGKTIQVLSLLLLKKHYLKAGVPSLLVVPTSLLGNWQSEAGKFTPSLKYKVLHGSSGDLKISSRVPKAVGELDFVLTTYGMILRAEWVQKVNWETVIADEAQAIKNPKTKQSQFLRSLKSSAKVAMTGTPVENSLGDLWSIFDFACPGLLGSQAKFRTFSKSMSEDSAGFAPLRELIAPYILRRKKTDKSVISDLPDKIELKTDCYLTKKQAVLYQKEVMRLEKSLQEVTGIQRKGLVLSSLMKFKQICNHPSQYLSNDSYAPIYSGKFEKLKELAESIASRQEKVLVFTQFRELTDILAHYLGECFGREGLVLHGGTHVSKRQKFVKEFQDPSGPPFFVLSLKAGGTGLNLTEANHVIHFDRWWNPAVEDQATDRAFRIGQTNNVLVHKFVCKGTVEEKIDGMISSKKHLSDSIVEGTKEIKLTELSDEELLGLVSLQKNLFGEVV